MINYEITSQAKKVCYIYKKEFSTNNEDKKDHKKRDHCHYTGKYRDAAHNICNLRYKTPKEIPVVFHNGSKYDYHFITKELAEEVEGEFECLGKNAEKYITFSVPIKKEFENGMSSSLSSLVDSLSEGLRNDKCTDCKSCLKYNFIKENQLIFNCPKYNKNHKNILVKTSVMKYEFCDGYTNEFILLLRKGIYPYQYMNSWKRFNETSLPEKEYFYSHLNMEKSQVLINKT